ncbi:hypothetical protein [Nocardia altamirensis]|uniref:hypothetical protein n=1 Tax=Nocardia altamirensis TaxID=472158 RepID=UPI0008402212|nr:hypothetical protein [Nocardia altamirensis]
MGTYLDSPNLPFSLHFATAESPAVAAAARDWISRGQIFTVTLTDGSDTTENRYLLMNFGAVSCLTLHNTDVRNSTGDQRITYGASLTKSGDLDVETQALSAHIS